MRGRAPPYFFLIVAALSVGLAAKPGLAQSDAAPLSAIDWLSDVISGEAAALPQPSRDGSDDVATSASTTQVTTMALGQLKLDAQRLGPQPAQSPQRPATSVVTVFDHAFAGRAPCPRRQQRRRRNVSGAGRQVSRAWGIGSGTGPAGARRAHAPRSLWTLV